jgi:phage tail sheath protein FI
MPSTPRTPGVYIDETGAFTASVVPVATAIPAFIGCTPRASYAGKSCTGVPVPISSFAEFAQYFLLHDAAGHPLPDAQQYTPVCYPLPAADPLRADVVLGGRPYDIQPDAGTWSYFYNSIRLFYQNGGGACHVVSTGPNGPAVGHGSLKGTPLVNPRLDLARLLAAVDALAAIPDVTMIVVPDATLLSAADNAALNARILAQCGELGSRIALFDLRGGEAPDPVTWMQDDIASFRAAIGTDFLGYGVAYYPFLQTGAMADADIDFTNVGGGAETLRTVLTGGTTDPTLVQLLGFIGQTGPSVPTAARIESALLAASSDYRQLHDVMLAKMNIAPPAAVMAGLYTMVDNQSGVWVAPANITPVNVTDVTLKITDAMQADLNVDPVTGKSINAIRLFPGRGVLVWGARTLDGNSQDWRYVNVRRTMIMLEQSMKIALQTYVFQPNDATTWSAVTSMLNNFLTSQWSAGALVGATPAAAFSVACGLGSTMTGEDILNGFMNVMVTVALTHPAEFLVITLQQQMQTS